jgi:hypothetical protein
LSFKSIPYSPSVDPGHAAASSCVTTDEYQGRDAAASFSASIFRAGRRFDLLPPRANGQPAFGAYLRAARTGVRHWVGLYVLTLSGDRICAMTRFENSLLP